jgi:hypothetical protein
MGGWRRIWTARTIVVRPELREILSRLLGTLENDGLAAEMDSAPELLKQYSTEMTSRSIVR